MARRSARAWTALSGCLVLACGAAPEESAPPGLAACAALERTEPPARRSVVLVVADTLRRDRLGVYGGAAATPAFDAFAGRALRFDAASSQAPWTKPSVATLFTGLHPSQHGVTSHPRLPSRGATQGVVDADALDDGAVTLAEDLARAGYETAAVVANPWLTERFGFAQGFEHWVPLWRGRAVAGHDVDAAAFRWLDARDGERPFFLYLHTMDAHAPYPPISPDVLAAALPALRADPRPVPAPLSRAIARRARDRAGRPVASPDVPANRALMELAYDQGVQAFDRALGELLAGLSARDPGGEIAVVVTSDHGEALFGHAYDGHGYGLYEEELAVPLVARLPGVRGGDGGVSGCPVGLIDLRATLCDYLGVSCSEDFGRSAFDAPEPGRTLVAEGVKNRARHRALRGPRYKLIWQPDGAPGPPALAREAGAYSLFDLASDPDETRDLLDGEPDAEARRAAALLRAALPSAVPAYAGPGSRPTSMDRETSQRLEALGYLDGS